MEILNYDWDRLLSMGYSEETARSLKDACWTGYEAFGMKKKGGRMVPNCVKMDSKHSEGDVATAEMTPNYLPKEPGKGDLKNPQMSEGVPQRMPRSDVLAKASDKNGTLAMRAAPNYAEGEEEDPLHSEEDNGRMLMSQLRSLRENVDSVLGMLDGSENLPPWVAYKISSAYEGMNAVGDFVQGAEEDYGENKKMPKTSKKPSPKMVQPAPQKGVKQLSKELVKEKTGSGRQKIINKIGQDVLEQA